MEIIRRRKIDALPPGDVLSRTIQRKWPTTINPVTQDRIEYLRDNVELLDRQVEGIRGEIARGDLEDTESARLRVAMIEGEIETMETELRSLTG